MKATDLESFHQINPEWWRHKTANISLRLENVGTLFNKEFKWIGYDRQTGKELTPRVDSVELCAAAVNFYLRCQNG